MHEMAITQGIVDLCLQYAGRRRVLSVDVEIGELGGVVPEALEFCFDACSRATLLEGARLNITRTPGTAECRGCGARVEVTSLYDACSRCGGYTLAIISGEELRVRAIDVED